MAIPFFYELEVEEMNLAYTETERDADFAWFVKNYEELYKLHGCKYLAIRHRKIIGAYDSIVDGITEICKKYPLGTFILQYCDECRVGYRGEAG